MSPEVVSASELEFLLQYEFVPQEVPDTVYNSPFLHLLVSAEHKNLPQYFTERCCQAGEIITKENDPFDRMYLIWSGRVAVVKGAYPDLIVLGIRGAGDIIGEMALLENQLRSATVIALEDLRLLSIDRENFQRLLNDTPSISLSIMEVLSSRLRRSDEARSHMRASEQNLSGQVSQLEHEKHHLEEIHRMSIDTSDLIIHDLRNPLSNMMVSLKMLEVVLPEAVLEQNRELLDIANSAGDRMQRLVNTLLDTSRIQSGQVELVKSEVDLQALIDTITKTTALVAARGITIHKRIPSPLPKVQADRDKVERVVINLVDNALKYAQDNGRVTVSAELLPASQVGPALVGVSVMDDGAGVPPEDRERIFERFAQAAGEKRRQRGFGLGLAFCQLAIEAHGGKIWVESGDGGVGSKFCFTLPV